MTSKVWIYPNQLFWTGFLFLSSCLLWKILKWHLQTGNHHFHLFYVLHLVVLVFRRKLLIFPCTDGSITVLSFHTIFSSSFTNHGTTLPIQLKNVIT